MARHGPQYGPDYTFLGVERCDLDDPATFASADVVIVGAPFDGGTSYRSGARFGPSAIRAACYLEHVVERVARAGAIPVVLGGDHTITWPDVTGVARAHGWGRVSVIHFDAHADTGSIVEGSLIGHGQPMRALIDSGAARGDRFLQVGLRGYWPPVDVLAWMSAQGMRSYEMTEVVARGLDACLTEAFAIATDDCDGVFLSVDIDVCDPGHAPGTGTPEPGGLSARELLDSVRRICYVLPVVGIDVVEVSPPYDHADITALLGNRVVLEALSAIARRRKDQRDGAQWDPRQPLLADRIPGE